MPPKTQKRSTKSEEFQSQLAEFIIVDEYEIELAGDNDDALELTCPQEDCNETFIVSKEGWTATRYATLEKSTVIIGRACPYCFRAGALPKSLRGDQ
jgi:hypothetical protein